MTLTIRHPNRCRHRSSRKNLPVAVVLYGASDPCDTVEPVSDDPELEQIGGTSGSLEGFQIDAPDDERAASTAALWTTSETPALAMLMWENPEAKKLMDHYIGLPVPAAVKKLVETLESVRPCAAPFMSVEG